MFVIPNAVDAGFSEQAEPDSLDFEIITLGFDRYGIRTGCAVSAQGTPDGTVAVASGVALIAGDPVTITSGNVDILGAGGAAADATHPRFDLITVNSAGTKARVGGVAALVPVFPIIPAGRTVLAAIYVPPNDAAINANQIIDKRILVREQADPSSLAVGESSISRHDATSNIVSTGSGSLRLSFMTARKTETINTVRIISGNTAAGATPTLIRIGVYTVATDGSLTLVASTPNDTSLLAAASTAYSKALSASFTKQAGTRYAIGVLVVTAATAPTLAGLNVLIGSESAQSPRLSGIVVAQTDLPASVASVGDSAHNPYCVLVP